MLKTRWNLLFLLFLTPMLACVRPKIHRAEVASRAAAEAREQLLAKTLDERVRENSTLIQQVSDLSKTVGSQDANLKLLQSELAARTQSMGESTGKLASEKAALQQDLLQTKRQLDQRNALLNDLKGKRTSNQSTLNAIESELKKGLETIQITEYSLNSLGDAVMLSLSDKLLFESAGSTVSSSGKMAMTGIAGFLSKNPTVDLDVEAHTDNVLPPKDKSLQDTWDWSLRRATNVVRLLIRDYNVNANQLTPIAKGEFYPLTSNETAEGRQRNRRTIFVFRPVLQKTDVVDE